MYLTQFPWVKHCNKYPSAYIYIFYLTFSNYVIIFYPQKEKNKTEAMFHHSFIWDSKHIFGSYYSLLTINLNFSVIQVWWTKTRKISALDLLHATIIDLNFNINKNVPAIFWHFSLKITFFNLQFDAVG